MCPQPNMNLECNIFEESHILVVEDSPINRAIIANYLRQLGCQVSLAEHGGEAVEMSQNDVFNIILMDIEMPVLDGFEATQQIRQEEVDTDEHAVIIAVTTRTSDEDRSKCTEVGMDDFLAKPVTETELQNTLTHWLCGG